MVKLKVARRIRDVSQWELSRQTGIGRSQLSLIENGYVEPTNEQVERIKAALNWTTELDECLEALVEGA